jgi:hypothetical protein
VIESRELVHAGYALATVFGAGLLSFPFLRASRPARIAFLSLLAVVALLAPLLVPMPNHSLRVIVSLASIMVAVKLYDLYRTVELGPPPGARAFLTYLPNECVLVLRAAATQNRGPGHGDAMRLLWLIPITLCCAFIAIAALRYDWRPYPWAVEHCAKAIAVCSFVQFGTNIGAAGRRLGGIPAQDFSGWFFGSATPAEFWRRWNKPAGQFLSEYVYRPAGGGRRRFAAVMATFALNGIAHEYVFGIAAGRVLGWSFLFFLIQGLATVATMRLRPAGWGRAAGILFTLAFNLGSSVLIFACVDAVLPYYTRRA